MINCVACNAENPDSGTICTKCGALLRLTRAKTYLDLAEADINGGQYEAAGQNLAHANTEILPLSATQRGEYLLGARAFWIQGLIYFGTGQLSEARREFLVAEQSLINQSRGIELLAKILNRLGGLYYYEEKFAQAEEYYRRSSDVALQIGQYALASTAAGNLGLIYTGYGEFERAKEEFTAALRQAEMSGSTKARANAARLLAWLHGDYGPYDIALRYAAQAAFFGEEITDIEMRCLCIGDAARVYLRAGQQQKAEAYFHEAYNTARQGNSKTMSEAMSNYIAEFLRHSGSLPLWFTTEAAAPASPTDQPLLFANSALRLAYYGLNQGPAAARDYLRWLEDSRSQHPNLSAEDEATVEHALALLHSVLGEQAAAIAHFTRALEGTPSHYEQACIWEEYAGVVLQQGGNDSTAQQRAQSLLNRAIALYQQIGLPQRAVQAMALMNEVLFPAEGGLTIAPVTCARALTYYVCTIDTEGSR
jgi:tetratricopeptide (TPR) repeat protein